MEIYNPYILGPLLAWLTAQIIKFAISLSKGEPNWQLLYGSGGMPSAHAAAVTALTTTALVYAGITSPIFGVVAIFSGIVIYDSFGVRRASGDQAMAINAILRSQNYRQATRLEATEVKELLGHKPIEVFAGILLGAVMALIISTTKWLGNVHFLAAAPFGWEQKLYLAKFLLFLILGVGAGPLVKLFYKKNVPVIKALRKAITWYFMLTAIIGLILVLGQYQEIPIFEWRLWVWLLLLIAAAVAFSIFYAWLRKIPGIYKEQLAKRRSSRRR